MDRRMLTVSQLFLSIHLPNDASIFTAETKTFRFALTGNRELDTEQAIIFSDSLSYLQALNNGKSDHSFILDILRLHQRHLSKGCNILFCWVPGHDGIHGNTKTDATAKAALDKDVTLINLPYTDFKQGINLYVHQLWQLAWGVQVDNKLYSLRPRVGTNTLPFLSRRDEVVLTRLRIGHTFFNPLFVY